MLISAFISLQHWREFQQKLLEFCLFPYSHLNCSLQYSLTPVIPILWLFYESCDYSMTILWLLWLLFYCDFMTPILWLRPYSLTILYYSYSMTPIYTDSHEYWYFLCDCFLKLLHMHMLTHIFYTFESVMNAEFLFRFYTWLHIISIIPCFHKPYNSFSSLKTFKM